MSRFDEQPDGDPHGECALEIRILTETLSSVITWLEANQPDVFRRGIWDAIAQPVQPAPQQENAE